MGAVQLIGVAAASLSLLAGWRLYACIVAAGLAMRFGLLQLPQQVHALDVLANPWVIGVAAVGAVAELFADKVMWLDSLWDGVHTLIRPLGGALLAMAVVDPADPLVAFLGNSWRVEDEIYQIRDFDHRGSRVLLRLDPTSVDLEKMGVHRPSYGWPLAWTRRYGEGRVFCSALGHEPSVWQDARYQRILTNAILWSMRRSS